MFHEVENDVTTVHANHSTTLELLASALWLRVTKANERRHALLERDLGRVHDTGSRRRNEAVPPRWGNPPRGLEGADLDLLYRFGELLRLGQKQSRYEHFASGPVEPNGRAQDVAVELDECHVTHLTRRDDRVKLHHAEAIGLRRKGDEGTWRQHGQQVKQTLCERALRVIACRTRSFRARAGRTARAARSGAAWTGTTTRNTCESLAWTDARRS